MTDPGNLPNHTLPSLMKRLWVHGFLVGFALVLVILLAWWFLWGTPAPSTTAEKETAPSPQAQPGPGEAARGEPAVAAPAPPAAAAALKRQLEEVLAGVREANLRQDLPQLVNLYAPDFPQRKEREQSISKSWKVYDYLDMTFRMDEVKSLATDRASARVTWDVETRNRKTKALKQVTKAYLAWFTKDSGQWRIQALENLAPRPQEKP